MGSSRTPAKTSLSRVFLIEGRARPDHKPSYESCLRMMGISQGFGDISKIEEPDPYNYDSFREVGDIRGSTERVTTSLEGRYAINLLSDLSKLARKKCDFDVQLHFGQCSDPSDFMTFEKVIVLEKAGITNYSTEDLGALQSDDNAPVNESVDVSAREFYEVLPISFGVKAGSIVTNEIVDITIFDSASCGECETESDGCYKIFGISLQAGGSPSTPPDIVYSLDKGETWAAHDIDTLGAAEDPTAVGGVGPYVFVVSNDTNSLHYALVSELELGIDPDFTEVTTGFVAGGEPNAVSVIGSIVYIAGDGGYVYKSEDITSSVTAIESGTVTSSILRDIHAFSEDFVVAVGDNGAVIYTENGSTFSAATTSPVGYGVTLNCVWVKSESEWWVGSNAGNLYYTLNGGSTWTAKAFPGSGTGIVHDIVFSTDSVGYLSHETASDVGRILRSYDGGYQWQITPERTGATLPANDRVNALAVCQFDANFVVGAGLADNATDGYIVLGLAS